MENNDQIVNFKYRKGIKEVYPAHKSISHWLFTEDTIDEAVLANQIAIVGEKNGLTVNDLQHIFPAILRILKDTSIWSK